MIYATSEAARYVTLIFIGVYTTSEIIAISLVLRRRHLEPLKFRDPILMLTVELLAYWTSMAYCLQYFYTAPSCLVSELLVIPFLLNMPFLLGRYWKLVLIYQITWARLHPDHRSAAWILRHTWLNRSRYVWAVMMVTGGVLVGVHIVVTIPSPLCFRSAPSNTFVAALMGLFTIFISVLAYHLRRIQEAFFVVRELQALAVIIVAGNIIVMVAGRDREIGDLIHYVVLALFQCQSAVQMWYPIRKSFQLQHDSRSIAAAETNAVAVADAAAAADSVGVSWTSSSIWSEATVPVRLNPISSLHEILHHPDGLAAYRRFLTMEFSVENLLCWEELESILTQPPQTAAAVRVQVLHVYQTFVCDGAPNEINISSELKNAFYDVVVEDRPVDAKIVRRWLASDKWVNLDEETQLMLRLLKRLHHGQCGVRSQSTCSFPMGSVIEGRQ